MGTLIGSKKISVIVPVYKVEKYLVRCVESILNQTYSNIEIILVDDGSPDNCPKLCDEYAAKDSRIRVIHKPNGGLSSARNAGMEQVTGEFVGFVDSDDWVQPTMYENCLSLIMDNNADIVQVGRHVSYGEKLDKSGEPKPKITIYNGKDGLQYYMESSTQTGSYAVWRCLYKTNLIRDLKFREGKINEDMDYNYKAFDRADRIVVTTEKLYSYFQNIESISNGGLNRKDFDLYDAANELESLSRNEIYGSIAFLGKVKQARTAFSLLSKIAYYGISDQTINKQEIVNKLTTEHRASCRVLLKAPLSLSRKVLAVCFVINYKFAECLVHLLKPIFKF